MSPFKPAWHLLEPVEPLVLRLVNDADSTAGAPSPLRVCAVALLDGTMLVAVEASDRSEWETLVLFVELINEQGWKPSRANLLFVSDFDVSWEKEVRGTVACSSNGREVFGRATLNPGTRQQFEHSFRATVNEGAARMRELLSICGENDDLERLLSAIPR